MLTIIAGYALVYLVVAAWFYGVILMPSAERHWPRWVQRTASIILALLWPLVLLSYFCAMIVESVRWGGSRWW